MLTKKLPLLSFLSVIFSSSFLLADIGLETEEPMAIEEHVSIGSREFDPKEKELIHERRIKEHENENVQKQEPQEGQLFKRVSYKLESNHSPFILAPSYAEKPQFTKAAYTALPVSSHTLYSIADNDLSVELEDGSHFEISNSYTVRTWRPGDAISITPDYSWFSSYDYYIMNKTTNTYVKANLHIGPIAFGTFSNWIVDIDYFRGHVYLQNGMIWCVNPQDEHLLKHWAINDHIISGLENSMWSYYDHILINVNMDEYIRVKQYQ